jgi:hypothetical protein
MLGDEAFKAALHHVRQGIVGGARVGILRIAASRRNHFGVQHRPLCRSLPERKICVPELGDLQQRLARVLFTANAAVFIKIGDIEYLPVRYPPPATGRTGLASNLWLDLK